MITLFGLWMHQRNTYLAKRDILTMDIVVEMEQLPSVTMIHLSNKYKGVVRFNGRHELEFELFERQTNALVKWSMQSNVSSANKEQLEEVLRPYFKALLTGVIEMSEAFLRYA